ncbi:hypothetical protein [Magnetofaba australis]|nr:hypothetical protein [Magnetofaba australis]
MGEEIRQTQFDDAAFAEFAARLQLETALLAHRLHSGALDNAPLVGGFELEAWLLDEMYAPAPMNQHFLNALDSQLAATELSRFNVEFNTPPQPLTGDALSQMHGVLQALWTRAAQAAAKMGARLMIIGAPPTLRDEHLTLDNLSPSARYRALNDQIMQRRRGAPIEIDIRAADERLQLRRHDIMLEAAATSFQIHLQTPASRFVSFYNAALAASAPLLAACCNSPLLFGRKLWSETRIAIFEQAIPTGWTRGGHPHLNPRVQFAADYLTDSPMRLFSENLLHYDVLLPETFEDPPERFRHLRLHNGAVWRWVRPVLGFDAHGAPALRIEQRCLPAGPTVIDCVANAALFYGLTDALADLTDLHSRLPFARAKENFYSAARDGLDATLWWFDDHRISAAALLEEQLIPMAREGLHAMGLERAGSANYVDIIEQRVRARMTGSAWQSAQWRQCNGDAQRMSGCYWRRQASGDPAHLWPLSDCLDT